MILTILILGGSDSNHKTTIYWPWRRYSKNSGLAITNQVLLALKATIERKCLVWRHHRTMGCYAWLQHRTKPFQSKGNHRTKVLGLEAIMELRQARSEGKTQPRYVGFEVNNRTKVCWWLDVLIEERPVWPEDSPRNSVCGCWKAVIEPWLEEPEGISQTQGMSA